jgi:hypothetical protein
MIGKDKLIYDATTVADGDSVAAYLYAGAKLTSTLVDTKQALDVNVVAVSGGVADDAVDSGNPLKIGSRAVDAALTELSAANDRADVISDLYRRIWVNDSPNIELDAADVDVTGTGALLVAANSGRRRILVQNLGNKAIYVGPSGVTVSSGIRIAGGAMLEIPLGEHLPIHAIAESGTQDVRYMQLA